MKILNFARTSLGANIYQGMGFGIAMTFCGGFIDAYTFIKRGGTLVAGQTGNVTFLSVDLATRNFDGALTKGVTMLAFMAGVFAVSILHTKLHSAFWRLATIVPLITFCAIVGFLPADMPDIYIVPPLALGMAMQTTAFSEVAGRGYNNAFTTGNLKKTMISLGEYVMHRKSEDKRSVFIYAVLVISFVAGGIASALLQKILGLYTILIAAVILAVTAGIYALMLIEREDHLSS